MKKGWRLSMNTKTLPQTELLLNTLRLIYVEDDAEALQELAHFLKKRVASLTTASNGLEALELCKKQSFDAMICDLWMPEMDGLTLIQSIREEGLQIPVIIISAFSDINTILKAIDLGIVKYCVKPIEADELITSLNRIALDKLSEVGTQLTSDSCLINRQERLELEQTLKTGFAHLLKTLTGKGPKKVHISLGTNDLEIWATDVLSPLETSLISTSEHAGMVPYLRQALYKSYRNRFETLISGILNRSVSLEHIRNNIEENTDWIVFKLR